MRVHGTCSQYFSPFEFTNIMPGDNSQVTGQSLRITGHFSWSACDLLEQNQPIRCGFSTCNVMRRLLSLSHPVSQICLIKIYRLRGYIREICILVELLTKWVMRRCIVEVWVCLTDCEEQKVPHLNTSWRLSDHSKDEAACRFYIDEGLTAWTQRCRTGRLAWV